MPKLLVFAVCEKVLIEDRGTANLIRIFDELTATIKEGTKVPKDAVGPTEWAIFTKWKKMPGDDDKEFVEVVQALWPDKTEFKRLDVPFRFPPDKSGQQLRREIVGFPVGQQGDVTLNMWLEMDSQRMGEIHTWTLNIKHEIVKP